MLYTTSQKSISIFLLDGATKTEKIKSEYVNHPLKSLFFSYNLNLSNAGNKKDNLPYP